MTRNSGIVYLVGAGPGNPDLITLKGKRCLEKAQVVVYDRLLDPALLKLAPDSSEFVFVGKERGRQADGVPLAGVGCSSVGARFWSRGKGVTAKDSGCCWGKDPLCVTG